VLFRSQLLASVKERVQQLEELFKKVEEKFSSSASYLPLLFKGVTELIEYFKKKKETKTGKKSTS